MTTFKTTISALFATAIAIGLITGSAQAAPQNFTRFAANEPAKCNMHTSQKACIACAKKRGWGPEDYMKPSQCGAKR